ncbi:Spore photoproduct lyase [bioreactor metagenome]|uniref:Spore photoproduct lyase n=1 Tax=bioreactor metagenome TaxID=1076179 RepID=A0A644ZLN5_9ZZZZ
MKRTIEFFAKSEYGRFRFVTKFDDVDTLLDIEHKGKTEARFTINTRKVIEDYEKRTGSREKRIEASVKMMKSGYPVGYIIAPVFMYENWEEDYRNLLIYLSEKIPSNLKYPITFEVISHRYTTRAKNIINEVFPDNTLPMKDDDRTYKYGQFGYGKFVYPKESLSYMKKFFTENIEEIFPDAEIKYII